MGCVFLRWNCLARRRGQRRYGTSRTPFMSVFHGVAHICAAAGGASDGVAHICAAVGGANVGFVNPQSRTNPYLITIGFWS
jgi:hypothetical protein